MVSSSIPFFIGIVSASILFILGVVSKSILCVNRYRIGIDSVYLYRVDLDSVCISNIDAVSKIDSVYRYHIEKSILLNLHRHHIELIPFVDVCTSRLRFSSDTLHETCCEQVVIVPIIKGPGEESDLVNTAVDDAARRLKAAGIRVKVSIRRVGGGRVTAALTNIIHRVRLCWKKKPAFSCLFVFFLFTFFFFCFFCFLLSLLGF